MWSFYFFNTACDWCMRCEIFVISKFHSFLWHESDLEMCFECLRCRMHLSSSFNGQIFHIFLLKTAKWQFGQTFQNKKNIYIFGCKWPNDNSNDLCMAELPFGRSHSSSNANGNWGIQNAPLGPIRTRHQWHRFLTLSTCCQRWFVLSPMELFTHDDRKKNHIVVAKCEWALRDVNSTVINTGRAWLIWSHSSARFCFELSGNLN